MKKKKWLALSLVAVLMTMGACSNDLEEKKETSKEEIQLTSEQKQNMKNNLNFEELFPNEEVRAYVQKMIGTKAPDFTVKNLKEEEIQLSKLKGKNVIVEIASTTCPACIQSYPDVDEFKDIAGDEVEVLTIFPNEPTKDVENFFVINEYERNDEVIAGEGMNSIVVDYQAQFTPTFIFIDKEGIIQFVHVGGEVSPIVLSSISDLSFKTNLTNTFNKVEEVPLEIPPVEVAPADTETEKSAEAK